MKREDDWLRDACAQLAEEETEQWEQSLTDNELRKADAVYRHHRRRALSLIRRGTPHKSPAHIWLRAAAALLLLAGALYLSLRNPPQEKVLPTQLAAVSLAPYYSPVPTSSPYPTMIWEDSPTILPGLSIISTEFPTNMLSSELTSSTLPTFMSTLPPTEGPSPTAAALLTPKPTAAPTIQPTPEPTAAPAAVSTDEPFSAPAVPFLNHFPSILVEQKEEQASPWYSAPEPYYIVTQPSPFPRYY